MPRPTTVTRTDTNGTTASTNADVTRWVTRRSVAARAPSTARDQPYTAAPDTIAAATMATAGETSVATARRAGGAGQAGGTPHGPQGGSVPRTESIGPEPLMATALMPVAACR